MSSYVLILYLVTTTILQTSGESVSDNLLSDGYASPHINLDSIVENLVGHYGESINVQENHYLQNEYQYSESSNGFDRRSGSLGYGGITGDINQRIGNVRQEIKELIGPAKQSVREEIAQNNRDLILLALVNFLGATFGVLLQGNGPSGLSKFMELPESNQILVLAQLMYGYGYVTPFALEYEKDALTCGLHDYESIEYEYSFIDAGYENPAVIKYFVTEEANRIKKALYCITSYKGSNSDAKKLVALIDLHAQLQRERLDP